MSEIQKLIQGYLDRRLTADQTQNLQAWIKADEENARTFVRYCLIHNYMRTECMEEDLRESLTVFSQSDTAPVGGDTGRIASEAILGQEERESAEKVQRIRKLAEHELQIFLEEQEQLRREQQSQSLRRMNAWQELNGRFQDGIARIGFALRTSAKLAFRAWILVSIVLLLVLVIHAQYRQRVIATLVEDMDAVWAVTPETQSLRPDYLELREGYAEIHFNNDVRILLTAPCRFDLHSPRKMTLHEGVLTAKVPQRAVGFTVRTPSSKVVDLGTEFGVRIDENGKTETAVFSGSLRFSGVRTSPVLGVKSLIVRENQQAQVSSSGELTGAVQGLDADHGYLLSWQDVRDLKQRQLHDRLYLPQVSGQCLCLRDKPQSLLFGQLESSDHMFVFLEGTDIVLQQDWVGPVISPGPLALQGPLASAHTLAAGRRVDSYIIHFDPVNPSPGEVGVRCRATIRFPRRIAGVITATEQLIEADKEFADPSIVYPQKGRGVEAISSAVAEHQVSIAEDLQTLTLDITASHSIDQMRVLIEAASPLSEEKPR